MQTIFGRFGIPTPENFSDYNLIGIDFGDGEVSASYVDFNNVEGKMTVSSLSLQENGTLLKNPNAFYISSDIQQLIYDVDDNRFTGQSGGTRYYNYKRCPMDGSCNSQFVKDDGNHADLTYGEIMPIGFNCLLNALFNSNDRISRKKPSFVLVGRPSSKGWECSELEYARMLQDGLNLPAGQAPVYIAIQSESTAALASELDPKWDKNRIQRGEVVVVLDNGSSTFDITVIAPQGGVVGENSVQFGGNQLDEILMQLLEQRSSEAGAGLRSKHGHKLGLRMKKEAYYGMAGKSHSTQIYRADLAGGKGNFLEFRLDEKTLGTALNAMPVRTFSFGVDANNNPRKLPPKKYPSWLAACKGIYGDFYEKMKVHFKTRGRDGVHPVIPDRIILSGGVSIMPEVQAAVKDAFGIEPTLTERPNYSVSTGLGYVLGTEVRKRQLLNQLVGELDGRLPNAQTLLDAIGDAGEDEEWTAFRDAMKEWSEFPEDKSVQEYYDLWKNNYYNMSLDESLQRGAERWYKDQKIERILSDMLREHFVKLFPEYVQQFQEKLPPVAFTGLGSVQVEVAPGTYFFGIDFKSKDQLTVPLNRQTRAEVYRQFLEKEQKVRKGGSQTFEREDPVEKGFSIFRRTVLEKYWVKYEYPGIRSMYINDKAVTPTIAEKTRGDIIRILNAPLTDYVETITPYFNMTARQEMEAKA